MANMTYLIGNGFDLNLGLRTRYTDFIKSYLESESNSKLIEDFKGIIQKEVSEDPEKWSDAEIAFGKLTSAFSELQNSGLSFNICQEDFCNALGEYLIKEEKRLTSELINSRKDISELLSRSIIGIANNLREVPRDEVGQKLDNLGGGFDINMLVFNYTRTVEMFMNAVGNQLGVRVINNTKYINRVLNIVHPHGTVEKDMVFGVNDSSQIGCPEIFANDDISLHSFIKERTNEINAENIERRSIDILSQSDVIFIYGMSLGETDKRWWERIIDLMVDKPNLCVIIGVYGVTGVSRFNARFLRKTREIQDLLLSYKQSLNDEDKETLRKRIYVDAENKFKMLEGLVPDPLKAAYIKRAQIERMRKQEDQDIAF